MTPKTPKDAPESPETGAKWVSVSEAAAAAGVSAKTIWRRAKAGEITARKVAGARGGFVWEVALNSTGQPTGQVERPDTQPTGQSNPQKHAVAPFDAQTERTSRADKTDRPTGQPSGHGDEMAARLLAQLEREVERLERDREAWRAQAEEASRQAATATAALREYMKAQPRQLTSGADSGQNGTGNAPISSDKSTSGQRDGGARKVPEIAPEVSEFSSYGALADWLESEA